MEIRRLVESDKDSFFECRLRALRSTPSAFLIYYEDEKAKGPDHFLKSLNHSGSGRAIFGAFDNKKLIGTIGIYKEEYRKISHKATIWGMHVDEAYRGKGVGGQLLDVALRFAKNEMGALSVSLSVESNNLPAKNLYLKKKFIRWGTEPKAVNHDGVLLDEDHMTLLFDDLIHG